MNYKKDNYYLNKYDSRIIRFVNNENQNSYEFYDLLSGENKKYFSEKLIFINNENKEEEINSSPFMNLSLIDCNFFILENEKYIINNSVKIFLNKIASFHNSSLDLLYEDNKFILKGSRLDDFNFNQILLNDDINDFFNKIELLKIPLKIEHKDEFIVKVLM